ncbi:hypothetical protein LC085_09230 [Bacillus tianshenii]|uniref:hypothetical protein n=1 Tax=Sutcliffiella tianshenii TaxID=1463404 RepID=UPI001CD4B4A3|nr:hypothetical protein [Bacillus tianshenii]MCA1320084.1 hypothetical protein [Bacillus tianshenii]
MAVSGGISILAYLNLIATGSSIVEFFKFILLRPECYLLPLGIGTVSWALFSLQKKKPTFREKD